jgi:hypothetical protein
MLRRPKMRAGGWLGRSGWMSRSLGNAKNAKMTQKTQKKTLVFFRAFRVLFAFFALQQAVHMPTHRDASS